MTQRLTLSEATTPRSYAYLVYRTTRALIFRFDFSWNEEQSLNQPAIGLSANAACGNILALVRRYAFNPPDPKLFMIHGNYFTYHDNSSIIPHIRTWSWIRWRAHELYSVYLSRVQFVRPRLSIIVSFIFIKHDNPRYGTSGTSMMEYLAIRIPI